MCLITDDKKLHVADKDITTFKLLSTYGNTIESPYYKFKYKLNTLYETEIVLLNKYDENWCPYCDMERDYLNSHYTDWDIEGSSDRDNLICVASGFHSSTQQDILSDDYYQLFECTIPKGSLYHKGFVGLMVSNKIIINKLISSPFPFKFRSNDTNY